MSYPTQLKKIVEAKKFHRLLFTLCILLLVTVIFEAGVMVGFRKARFSYQAGNRYFENLNGPRGMMPLGIRDHDFTSSHGAIGKIVKIDLPSVVVETADGAEKVIMLTNHTAIRRFKDTLKDTDLKLDDSIITLGSPQSNGAIDARLIRVLPLPLETSTSSPKEY